MEMQQTRNDPVNLEDGRDLQEERAASGADWTVSARPERPILFVDVDGVISVFGFPIDEPPPGSFHTIDGIVHCISERAGDRLARLASAFDLVWATGWEEKANEYLPHLLSLDGDLPVLSFDGRAVFGSAHWKVDAIDAYAANRPAAWIDDFIDETCREWAERRSAPTLLIETDSATGITDGDVEKLLAWAAQIAADRD